MHKPTIRPPKLRSSHQTIIEQTQRISRHKCNALASERRAACFDARDESGVGLLVRGFDVGAGLLGVAGDAADRPVGDVGWEVG